MQPIAPAPARHQSAGKFVNDGDFVVLHDVMLVAVIELMRAQGRIHMVHQADIGGVVKARAFRQQASLGQQHFGVFMTVFGQVDLMRFFVDSEVAGLDHALAGARVEFADLLFQPRCNLVDGQVQIGLVIGLTGNDQRCTRLVNQDRIDLVNDREGQRPLHAIGHIMDHVVAQIVETIFVVGAVSHIGCIGGLLLLTRHLRQVHAN